MTAAQALLMAEALAPEKPKAEIEMDTKLGKPKDRKRRKVPRSTLLKLANKGGELEGKPDGV